MARVITTSSGFFCVLPGNVNNDECLDADCNIYIVASPFLLGARWLRIELSLSVAIFSDKKKLK